LLLIHSHSSLTKNVAFEKLLKKLFICARQGIRSPFRKGENCNTQRHTHTHSLSLSPSLELFLDLDLCRFSIEIVSTWNARTRTSTRSPIYLNSPPGAHHTPHSPARLGKHLTPLTHSTFTHSLATRLKYTHATNNTDTVYIILYRGDTYKVPTHRKYVVTLLDLRRLHPKW